jgi:methanogenic corrinoid protein MtbC1
MGSLEGSNESLHPIQVVSRRTGLTPDVIRVWERRYHAVTPERSATNRRLYSDADVERLLLLRRATLAGRRIGDVAGLPSDELEALVVEDETATSRAPVAGRHGKRSAAVGTDEMLGACLEAVEALDAEALELTVSRAALQMPPPVLIGDLLTPLLREIGERWRSGALMAAHEHMTTATVRSFLGAMSRRSIPGEQTPPHLIVTTPAGQQHELGALMVAATASLEGWQVTYLGPSLPAEDIAAAAIQRDARAVALSVLYPADDPRLPEELRRLRRLLPDHVAIVAGGDAASGYRNVLSELGILCRSDLDTLRRDLETLRHGSD